MAARLQNPSAGTQVVSLIEVRKHGGSGESLPHQSAPENGKMKIMPVWLDRLCPTPYENLAALQSANRSNILNASERTTN